MIVGELSIGFGSSLPYTATKLNSASPTNSRVAGKNLLKFGGLGHMLPHTATDTSYVDPGLPFANIFLKSSSTTLSLVGSFVTTGVLFPKPVSISWAVAVMNFASITDHASMPFAARSDRIGGRKR